MVENIISSKAPEVEADLLKRIEKSKDYKEPERLDITDWDWYSERGEQFARDNGFKIKNGYSGSDNAFNLFEKLGGKVFTNCGCDHELYYVRIHGEGDFDISLSSPMKLNSENSPRLALGIGFYDLWSNFGKKQIKINPSMEDKYVSYGVFKFARALLMPAEEFLSEFKSNNIRSMMLTFGATHSWVQNRASELEIERYTPKTKEIYESGRKARIEGFDVWVMNTHNICNTHYAFDRGNDVAAIYYDNGDKRIVELRSAIIDVGEIARKRGGEGNKRKAMFETNLGDTFQ